MIKPRSFTTSKKIKKYITILKNDFHELDRRQDPLIDFYIKHIIRPFQTGSPIHPSIITDYRRVDPYFSPIVNDIECNLYQMYLLRPLIFAEMMHPVYYRQSMAHNLEYSFYQPLANLYPISVHNQQPVALPPPTLEELIQEYTPRIQKHIADQRDFVQILRETQINHDDLLTSSTFVKDLQRRARMLEPKAYLLNRGQDLD